MHQPPFPRLPIQNGLTFLTLHSGRRLTVLKITVSRGRRTLTMPCMQGAGNKNNSLQKRTVWPSCTSIARYYTVQIAKSVIAVNPVVGPVEALQSDEEFGSACF